MLKVLIADDHAIVRHGLVELFKLQSDMKVVGEAKNGQEALQKVKDLAPDILTLDISLGDKHGLDVLKQLKRDHPKLKVLILSMFDAKQYAVRAIRNGASGYLNKESAPTELIAAINTISKGRRYVTAELAELLADSLDEDPHKFAHESLSDREFQTLLHIAAGMTPSEIADTMHISVKTFNAYRARVLDKMQLKNNVELTRYVLEKDLRA